MNVFIPINPNKMSLQNVCRNKQSDLKVFMGLKVIGGKISTLQLILACRLLFGSAIQAGPSFKEIITTDG